MDQSQTSNWFDNEIMPFQMVEKAHLTSIETLAFNPENENELVTGGHDKLIKVWDYLKLKPVSILEGHSEGVWSTEFSNDGKILLSGSPDKSLILWDLKKKKPAQTLKEHKNKVYWCNFNENSKFIASGGEDSRLIIWDLRKAAPLKIIKSDSKIIYNVKWSKCGKFLFSSEYGGLVKVYDTMKFDLQDQHGQFKEEARAWTCDMDFRENSKTGSNVFVGYENKHVKVFNFDKKTSKLKFDYEFMAHMDPIKNITVNGPKGLMVTSCRDGSARVWDTTKPQGKNLRHKVIASLSGITDNVSCSQFAPTKKGLTIIGTVSWDQGLRFYKI